MKFGLLFNVKKEKELCSYYEKNIKKFFEIDNISKSVHRGCLALYWRDKPLRIWLSKHFRREWKGKMLPDWFAGVNKTQFDCFIKGWIESDGHIDENGRTSITTKESDLAMFSSLLGLNFGRMIGLRKVRINAKDYHKLIIPKSNRGYKFKEKYVLVGIYSIKELRNRDSRTKLYNLQVEDDESYCTSMISLHNCQIHMKDEDVKLFTRRLENVTKQVPEVVLYLKECVKVKSCILDAEAVGFNPVTQKYIPFQKISQRIRRKYDIEDMADKFPVEVNIFDILFHNDKSLLNNSFKERRKILEKIVKQKPRRIVLAKQIITSNLNEAQKFYDESLKLGEEGVMAKNLDSTYKPGSRVGYGVKIKPILEPLDLVIVAAEYGEGKRSGWLASFYLACSDNTEFKEIGKVSTGLKELEKEGVTFKKLTELLKPLITKSSGKHVELTPRIVIEVGYEEIQKSVNYGSGYALRFPRFLRLRIDEKTIADINTLKEIESLFAKQRN